MSNHQQHRPNTTTIASSSRASSSCHEAKRLGSASPSRSAAADVMPRYGGDHHNKSSPSSSLSRPATAGAGGTSSFPEQHHRRLQQRSYEAHRKLGVQNTMLTRMYGKVGRAPSPSPQHQHRPETTPQRNTSLQPLCGGESLSSGFDQQPQHSPARVGLPPTPVRSSSLVESNTATATAPMEGGMSTSMSRLLTPIRSNGGGGTSPFLSTSRRPKTPILHTANSPMARMRKAKKDAYLREITQQKQFISFLSLLQNTTSSPARSVEIVGNEAKGDPSTNAMVVVDGVSTSTAGGSVRADNTTVLYFPESSSLATLVQLSDDDEDVPSSPPPQKGVLVCHVGGGDNAGCGGGDWTTSSSGVFSPGDLEGIISSSTQVPPPPAGSSPSRLAVTSTYTMSPCPRPPFCPFAIHAVVILGPVRPPDLVALANVVSSHPTLEALHLVDTPLDSFLRRSVDSIVTTNDNIQHLSWKQPPLPLSPSLPSNSDTHSSDGDDGSEWDNEEWCLAGSMSGSSDDNNKSLLSYFPPTSPTSRRQTLTMEGSRRMSMFQERRNTVSTMAMSGMMVAADGEDGHPPQSSSVAQPREEESWRGRLSILLRTAKPALGPTSTTALAQQWFATLLGQLESNRRVVRRRVKRRKQEADYCAYIERLDVICFEIYSELVVTEHDLRNDIYDLQAAQRTQLYALAKQDGRRALRLNRTRMLLDEIGQRLVWVQGREAAFREAIEGENVTERIDLLINRMQPGGRVALITTEVMVRGFAKAFESTSWSHYRGLQRNRQRRQQLEKDSICGDESEARVVISREWMHTLRRHKEREGISHHEILMRPPPSPPLSPHAAASVMGRSALLGSSPTGNGV